MKLRWCRRSSVKMTRSSLEGPVSLTRKSVSPRRCVSSTRHNFPGLPCLADSRRTHPLAISCEVGVMLRALSVSLPRTLETTVTILVKPPPPPKPPDPTDLHPKPPCPLNPAMLHQWLEKTATSSDLNGTGSRGSLRCARLRGPSSSPFDVEPHLNHLPRSLALPSPSSEGIEDVFTEDDTHLIRCWPPSQWLYLSTLPKIYNPMAVNHGRIWPEKMCSSPENAIGRRRSHERSITDWGKMGLGELFMGFTKPTLLIMPNWKPTLLIRSNWSVTLTILGPISSRLKIRFAKISHVFELIRSSILRSLKFFEFSNPVSCGRFHFSSIVLSMVVYFFL
ncbi:unnamed protein product [Arabis nemorensis]|uniref:Uncharacterized protein n=1 Tax=Arabis nemorensis TaxID=586526 RepID=A0A565AV83_9BRAS|nr:unnamed protein product [Arabis nemorensis]